MPALTHNRVKNGFNGGIRKRNASASVATLRTMNMGKVDGNVHILQLQFFCDQLKHDLLIKYWKEVADHFATIKTTRKDWL